MQARLSLGDKRQSRVSSRSIWNEFSQDRSTTHLALLRALPAVRVGQYKVNFILDGRPEVHAVGMRFCNVLVGAAEEVDHEVGKNLDYSLVKWEGWYFGGDLSSCPWAESRAQVKFKPARYMGPFERTNTAKD